MQCDGYAAYKTIANAVDDAITLAFCWSHLRRRFFDIAESGAAPIASETLARIAALYAIEKTIRGRSADERRAVRQTRSKRRRARSVTLQSPNATTRTAYDISTRRPGQQSGAGGEYGSP